MCPTRFVVRANPLLLILAFSILCVLFARSASAVSDIQQERAALRLSVDFQRYTLSESDFDLPAILLGVGVPVGTGVMLEVTAGEGLDEDGIGDLTLQLSRYADLSLRMTTPPTESGYRLMSRLGLTFADLEQSSIASAVTTNTDFSGFHISLGVERPIFPSLLWSLEAVYLDLDRDIESWSVRGSVSWVLQP